MMYPNTIATVIPPAVPLTPPVKTPIIPLSSTSFITPLASEYPKPGSGTVAPDFPTSTIFSYMPNP